MATITEDYVSFETAKLLKEKSFDEECLMVYIDGELFNYYDSDFPSEYELENDGSGVIDAPTLQMAMKWLREKHNIVVEPFIREDTKYVWYIHRIETKFNKKYLVFCWGSKNNKYERYEQACEAAIKYCLENLI